MLFCTSVPPRPPYSVGQTMPAHPAAAFSASQRRRSPNASSSSIDDQKPGSRHSAGMLPCRYSRSSVRNCSSASL